MDPYDELGLLRYRRGRSRLVGSVGSIAFVAGAFGAGQIMSWLGLFRPGTTPNGQILEYWPGFLIGGLLLGIPAAIAARIFYAFYCSDD